MSSPPRQLSNPGRALGPAPGPLNTPKTKKRFISLLPDHRDSRVICLTAKGVTVGGQIYPEKPHFMEFQGGGGRGPRGVVAARSPPAACCCSLQQSNRPPVQRQLPSRAEPALRKKLNRVDVAEKRSAAEEDDFREETGDKEDCGNDRTLALPRTTRKRLTEEQSVLL